jgi:uncharacterized membrane protein SirB2
LKKGAIMSLRFVTSTLLMLAGGLIVVFSQALTAETTGWVAFGLAIAIVAGLVAVQADRARPTVQRLLDGVVGVLGIWTIIASVVFAGSTLTWLSFAEALGFAGLGLVGMIVHELSTERVVHSLAVTEAPSDSYRTAA